MVTTVFRSRFRENLSAAELTSYAADAAEMRRLAEGAPGFVFLKTYAAEDGERITVVRFASPESQHAWARHPAHLEAQQRGRRLYYAWYEIGVYDSGREWTWPRTTDAVPHAGDGV